MVQYVAVCCSVLQCVAVCCSVLQCVAVCCSVLQCVAVCCSVLQCVAMCCSVLRCVATERWTRQHPAIENSPKLVCVVPPQNIFVVGRPFQNLFFVFFLFQKIDQSLKNLFLSLKNLYFLSLMLLLLVWGGYD